jgi:hypothetical protein
MTHPASASRVIEPAPKVLIPKEKLWLLVFSEEATTSRDALLPIGVNNKFREWHSIRFIREDCGSRLIAIGSDFLAIRRNLDVESSFAWPKSITRARPIGSDNKHSRNQFCYSRRAVGSHGIAEHRLASKLSIASRYCSVTSISSMPRTSRSFRKGLMSKEWEVRSGAISA